MDTLRKNFEKKFVRTSGITLHEATLFACKPRTRMLCRGFRGKITRGSKPCSVATSPGCDVLRPGDGPAGFSVRTSVVIEQCLFQFRLFRGQTAYAERASLHAYLHVLNDQCYQIGSCARFGSVVDSHDQITREH